MNEKVRQSLQKWCNCAFCNEACENIPQMKKHLLKEHKKECELND